MRLVLRDVGLLSDYLFSNPKARLKGSFYFCDWHPESMLDCEKLPAKVLRKCNFLKEKSRVRAS